MCNSKEGQCLGKKMKLITNLVRRLNWWVQSHTGETTKSYTSIVQSDTWFFFYKARRRTDVNDNHDNNDKFTMSIAWRYIAIPHFKFRFVPLGVMQKLVSVSLHETTAQLSILNYLCAWSENDAIDTDERLSR